LWGEFWVSIGKVAVGKKTDKDGKVRVGRSLGHSIEFVDLRLKAKCLGQESTEESWFKGTYAFIRVTEHAKMTSVRHSASLIRRELQHVNRVPKREEGAASILFAALIGYGA
jgi:hypothetical protein